MQEKELICWVAEIRLWVPQPIECILFKQIGEWFLDNPVVAEWNFGNSLLGQGNAVDFTDMGL